jgi:hypothetical protein
MFCTFFRDNYIAGAFAISELTDAFDERLIEATNAFELFVTTKTLQTTTESMYRSIMHDLGKISQPS